MVDMALGLSSPLDVNQNLLACRVFKLPWNFVLCSSTDTTVERYNSSMVSSNTKSSHSEQKTDPDFASVPELCEFGKKSADWKLWWRIHEQNVCPVSFRWFVMWPSDQHPANEQCRQTNGRESVWLHVSQVGEDTCKTGGQIYHFTRYFYINSQRTFLRFAGCRESCVLRAYQATTVLNLSMIPAFADGSAKTEVICEHLSISFSEASEETDGSIPGCASVDSSPKRAVSGDADMPETSK